MGPLGIKVTNVEPGSASAPTGPGAQPPTSRPKIADYKATAGQNMAIIQGCSGQQPGDPERAAQACCSTSCAWTIRPCAYRWAKRP
ncbi:MAG: hypothetical protein WKG07_19135 [Hymenobacter sp.]